ADWDKQKAAPGAAGNKITPKSSGRPHNSSWGLGLTLAHRGGELESIKVMKRQSYQMVICQSGKYHMANT
ncbi:MAG: hypothetical protein ACYDGX_04970, partial [Thermoleophilia bacterium]